jgi:hypothetical protein
MEPAVAIYRTAFFEEGMRRWEAEQHRNTLTGVAAANLLSMTAVCHGKDDIAHYYQREAVAMGQRMGLYGVSESESARGWLDNHHAWIRAASHTAWGAYNSAMYVHSRHPPCLSLTTILCRHHCLQYQTALVKHAPQLPVPGKLGSVLSRAKGDRYESYPMPDYTGQTFNKLCELFQIAHKVLWEYYDGIGQAENTPIQRVSLQFAEKLFHELLAWSASLPLELARTEANPHHTILLQ